jgi:nucleoside-diphosphate-sugar epimerase
LITGANGQIGSVLTDALQKTFGLANVIATDIRDGGSDREGIFELLNVLDAPTLGKLIDQYHITQVYHLAAILSARGEAHPIKTWDVNMNGLFNILEVAREKKVRQVFFPSSIAVFGSDIPRQHTPQNAVLKPTTVYGMSKVAGELWCQYYFKRYGLDVRSLRYPGVIGYQSEPGGGTTDYAVEIYHYALRGKPYACFLKKDTILPMIYMDDVIRATLEVMNAPADSLTVRTSYNLAGMSFSPGEIAESIRREVPAFQVLYQPDFRQDIADSWPRSIDDSSARADWRWKPRFDLPAMTKDMLFHLQERYVMV